MTEGTEETVLTRSNEETETNREFNIGFKEIQYRNQCSSPFVSVTSLLCVKTVASVPSVTSRIRRARPRRRHRGGGRGPSATRSRRRFSVRPFRCCSRAATCSARPRPAPGKTAAFALPMLQRLSPARRRGSHAARRGLVLVPTRELAMQVAEAVHKYARGRAADRRSRSTAARRCCSRSARSSAAPTSSSRRPAARSITSAADADARPARRARPRRSRRDARHGLRRGPRRDPRRHAARRGRRRCSRRRCRRGFASIAAAPPERSRRASRSRARSRRRQAAARPPGRLHRRPRAQAGGARARARDREPRRRRSSSAARGSRWTRSSRRSTRTATAPKRCTAAWSSGSAIAVMSRFRDGDVGPAGRDRRRGARPRHPAAVARHQLRRAGLARGLRAPHRAHRPRRPRGHGDHAGRAARAPPAAEHRGGSPSRRSRSRPCRRSPTCARGGSSSPAPRCASGCSPATSITRASSSNRSRPSSTSWTSRRRRCSWHMPRPAAIATIVRSRPASLHPTAGGRSRPPERSAGRRADARAGDRRRTDAPSRRCRPAGGNPSGRSRRRDHRRSRHPVARDRRDRDQRWLLAGRSPRRSGGPGHRRAARDDDPRVESHDPPRALMVRASDDLPAARSL